MKKKYNRQNNGYKINIGDLFVYIINFNYYKVSR